METLSTCSFCNYVLVFLVSEDQCLTLQCPNEAIRPIANAVEDLEKLPNGQHPDAWNPLLKSIEFFFEVETKKLYGFIDGTKYPLFWYEAAMRFSRRQLKLTWDQDVNQVDFQILPKAKFLRIVKGKEPFRFSVRKLFPECKYCQGRLNTAINAAIVAKQLLHR